MENKMTRKIISKQSEWLEICPEFENANAYDKFKKKYQFNPESKIYRAGLILGDMGFRKTKQGLRRQIFEGWPPDGATVEDCNAHVKSSDGKPDADIFIGLYKGFFQLDVTEFNNGLKCQTSHSTIFMNNRSQAVRLPKQVAFPEDVHQVEIIKIGHSRVISPVGRRWDDLFQNGPRASEDFMGERTDPPADVR